MEKIRKHKKTFLYGGLGLLFVSFAVKWLGVSIYCFWILFCMAIILKALFLICAFSSKGFKPGLWLYLILAGAVMILISMIFKTAVPVPVLHKILFYGAVSLKTAGLLLMIFYRQK
ncbi:MAG: hypothetical protein LBP63_09625 [Prevotellaceae bacterium]|jgi:hypothetical protein|nr:hypothetical protein [Prevotellaceae bacterium]